MEGTENTCSYAFQLAEYTDGVFKIVSKKITAISELLDYNHRGHSERYWPIANISVESQAVYQLEMLMS